LNDDFSDGVDPIEEHSPGDRCSPNTSFFGLSLSASSRGLAWQPGHRFPVEKEGCLCARLLLASALVQMGLQDPNGKTGILAREV
jgi:hypothetical protein